MEVTKNNNNKKTKRKRKRSNNNVDKITKNNNPPMHNNATNDLYLPVSIIELIMKHLTPKKALQLSSVSKDWGAAASRYNPTVNRKPLLVHTSRSPNTPHHMTNVQDRANKSLTFFIRNDQNFRNHACIGSVGSWLVYQKHFDLTAQLSLLNPFSQARFDLPPLHTGKDILYDLFLSSVPSSNDFIVVAVLKHNKFRMWRPGDEEWGHLTDVSVPLEPQITKQVTRFRGKFYGISEKNSLVSIDFSPFRVGREIEFPFNAVEHVAYHKRCLVECNGELLLVELYVKRNAYVINGLNVYLFDVEKRTVVRVRRINDWAIFVNRNGSFSVCARTVGCRGNCVYFTDLSPFNAWHCFDIETEECFTSSRPDISLPLWNSPKIWIVPSMV